MLNIVVFTACLLLACSYAGWRGGEPERLAAISLLVAAVATRASLLLRDSSSRFASVEHGTLLVDVLLLAVLFAIALRANRIWPLCITSLHLSTALVHAARLIDPAMVPWVYQFLVKVAAYPMLVVLAVGTLRHRARLRTRGVDRAWS